MGLHTAFLTLALLLSLIWGQLHSPGAHPHASLALHIAIGLSAYGAWRYWKPSRHDTLIILLIATLCRLALLPLQPSDDIYRYIAEGIAQNAGENPYITPPEKGNATFLPSPLSDKINHPEMTAIYPPGILLTFRGLSKISTNPALFKTTILLIDLATLALLLKLLTHLKRKLKWALLYALNPVILLAFAGEAHLDAYMLLPMVTALYLLQRKHHRTMFIALSLAIQAKYAAIILLPFLITPHTWKKTPWILPGLLLPFALFPPYTGYFDSLNTFATNMHFNGPLYEPLWALLQNTQTTTLITTAALLITLIILRLCIAQPTISAAWAFLLLCLLSSNTHAWYLTWFIPFLCLRPSATGITWCFTISLTYITYGQQFQTGHWQQTPSIVYTQTTLLALALLYDYHRQAKTLHDNQTKPPLKTLSIIIPVLNDQHALHKLLTTLHQQQQHPKPQIIIIDGGSSDNTLAIAQKHNTHIIQGIQGRGSQIAAGTRQATNDALLILHADTLPQPNTLPTILHTLNHTGIAGGALGGQFDRSSPALKLIRHLNRLRAQHAGISFGDQGQFIRKDTLEQTGGFPDQPLMEDIELSLRLKEIEPPLYLNHPLTVSARSWQKAPATNRALLIIRLVATYLTQRFFKTNIDTSTYYQRYYNTP